ncbi:helix-turn-helix transcriptional regulator [Lactobacillus mulieris]|uniref:helix-turn-helix domain-containing protein n=1 Tax=Lactobacillus mulieris TaxID=2508708 RepID=UPI001197B151|nr:helix-turn-helix transcriptional regulator [Lactobacillus jensenii]
MTNNKLNFSPNRLRQLRKKHRFSQQFLSDLLGRLGLQVNQSTISRYETGKEMPVLKAFAVILDTTVEYLQGRKV